MFLFGKYLFKFCLTSTGPYDIQIVNVGINIEKVKPREAFS